MPTASIRVAARDGQTVSAAFGQDVEQRLRQRSIRLRSATISALKREDLNRVVLVPRKHDPLLIFPVGRSDLVRGLRRIEIPIRFSALRLAGFTLDFMFERRMIDSCVIMYCQEEIAVVVSASRLMEHLG